MKVAHILAELRHSGAERMLACSLPQWHAVDVEPVVIGMSEGAHPFGHALDEAGYEVILLPSVRSVRGLKALSADAS